jgi:hypothetical protein
MKYRTVKWARTKIRLPEVVEWQGHELKLERHINSQWANWYFGDGRISLHLSKWLNLQEGECNCYSLTINWEFVNPLQYEISCVVRGATLEETLKRTTIVLNDLYETLPEDFPE